ncbi:MAG: hypothetical protein COA49_05460 [Bacteroidetes bacterium]|nr:MAG: hypothetical protein COA49_05460 [Bacteroidota bacterium]
MQLQLFHSYVNDEILEDLFEAYYGCRKNKRNTPNAVKFEMEYEKNLFQLYDELIYGQYEIGRSTAFIVKRPVKREIFAADFRDRVVHHYLIKKLNPLFEELFINNSFACREGRGGHFGIRTIVDLIEKESMNYKMKAFILKLDVQGFFMNIDRKLLFDRLVKFINEKYLGMDKSLILYLVDLIVNNDSTFKCIVKGKFIDWADLPNNKSLFHTPDGCGLPIGNYTSQVFANFYLHILDEFVTEKLGVRSYGRYVDDFVLVHTNKKVLVNAVREIEKFLKEELNLMLHPQKRYLQEAGKGVEFLGVFIKPNRVYIGSRIKNGFYESIRDVNKMMGDGVSGDNILHLIQSFNSYLGMMVHYSTFRLRKKLIFKNLDKRWWKYVYLSRDVSKFIVRKRYKQSLLASLHK